MTISFYDASVGAYLQILDSTMNVLEKGAASGLDPATIVQTRLHDNMLPFHFQIASVCHHSWGAMNGMRDGRFAPPSSAEDKDYAGLQAMLKEARDGVASYDEAGANALADGSLIFALGERELPFSNKNFLLTFSLPNFYFHAATTYDILRMLGVELGKPDFLGRLKIG